MKRNAGNALIYVLIAIVLFAALSFALTRSLGKSGGASRLDDDKANLRAEELIQYATAARSTIEQMQGLSNVLPAEFNFVKPGETGYDTGTNTPKVYHPGGGGMNVFTPSPELFASNSGKRGWVAQQGTNVQWSASSASDIIFSFVDVDPAICAAINKRLYKNPAIAPVTLTADVAFIGGGGDDADFTIVSCSDCNNKVSMCVRDSAGANVFYNMILSR